MGCDYCVNTGRRAQKSEPSKSSKGYRAEVSKGNHNPPTSTLARVVLGLPPVHVLGERVVVVSSAVVHVGVSVSLVVVVVCHDGQFVDTLELASLLLGADVLALLVAHIGAQHRLRVFFFF